MKTEDFEQLVEEVTGSIKKILTHKAKEYAHGDRLYNFKKAAKISGNTPLQCCCGMWLKHLVSVLDIVNGKIENTEKMVVEKFIDSINYHILMMAILDEERDRKG
jgi:hypothetical protein